MHATDKQTWQLEQCSTFKACPVTPVFFVLSLPARSTRLSLLVTARSSPSPSMRICMWMVKTVCDLDDALFRAWLDVDLLASPAGSTICLAQFLKYSDSSRGNRVFRSTCEGKSYPDVQVLQQQAPKYFKRIHFGNSVSYKVYAVE